MLLKNQASGFSTRHSISIGPTRDIATRSGHETEVGHWQEEAGTAPQTARQPLLTQCRIEDGEKGTQVLHFNLDASHGYLQEHCIDGIPVLPAAVALEIIAEAATLMWPGWIVAEVAELRLLKGVQLSEPTQALSLLINPPTYASSEGFDASISIRSGSGKQQRMHYRAASARASPLDGLVCAQSVAIG